MNNFASRLTFYITQTYLAHLCNVNSQTSQKQNSNTVTDYELDVRRVGFRVPVGSRMFAYPYRPDWLWGPYNLLSNWYMEPFLPGVRRQGRKTEHSPTNNDEKIKFGS
jgi:hypothetical protein